MTPLSPVSADVLDVRNAILGEGLVLHRTDEHVLVIHSVDDAGHAHRVGEFRDATAAWRAIDALDSAELARGTGYSWEQSLAA
jgi:hypothetical protein